VIGGLGIIHLQNALFSRIKVEMIIRLICNITRFYILKILCERCLIFLKIFTGTRKAKVYGTIKTISWEDKKYEDTNCSFHYGSGMSIISVIIIEGVLSSPLLVKI